MENQDSHAEMGVNGQCLQPLCLHVWVICHNGVCMHGLAVASHPGLRSFSDYTLLVPRLASPRDTYIRTHAGKGSRRHDHWGSLMFAPIRVTLHYVMCVPLSSFPL